MVGNVLTRVDFKVSVLVFSSLRNLAPSYLTNMC